MSNIFLKSVKTAYPVYFRSQNNAKQKIYPYYTNKSDA